VSVVTSNKLCQFAAGAQCHPAMLDPSEAAGIEMPLLMIASGDEDADTVKQYEDGLKVPKHFERFGGQVHGFMTARADLEDEKVKAEYERAYRLVISFFDKHV
jgi:dienelactone hydrolase